MPRKPSCSCGICSKCKSRLQMQELRSQTKKQIEGVDDPDLEYLYYLTKEELGEDDK